MSGEPILGWHWVSTSGRLRDGRLVRAGRWYRLPASQEPILCERGFHASRRPLDALYYAPGPIVCRVELRGTIIEASDKVVASERRVLWMADATHVLRRFTLWCAERAVRRARREGCPIDPRLREALRMYRAWLAGANEPDLATKHAGEVVSDLERAMRVSDDPGHGHAWALASLVAWALEPAAGNDVASHAERVAREAAWWGLDYRAEQEFMNRTLTSMLLELAPAAEAQG